jgi:hypothetical protein
MADPVRDFASNEDGEWIVFNGDFVKAAGANAVPQGIRIRVGMFLGECYLDEGVGVPYLEDILIKNPDPLVVRADIQEAIANTPDVTNVVGAQLVQEQGSRDARIDYVCDTVYSEQPFSGSVEVP